MMNEWIESISESILQFVGIFLLVVFLMIVWYIVDYIFRSLSLYKLGKAMSVSAYGLAWVPFARYWVAGGIVDKHDAETGKDHKFRWVLICLMAIAAVLLVVLMTTSTMLTALVLLPAESTLDAMPLFGSWIAVYILLILSTVVYGAFWIICIYKLIELCKPQSPVLNFMIGMLVPFAFPFVLFSCANAYIRRAEEAQAMEAARVAEEAQAMEAARVAEEAQAMEAAKVYEEPAAGEGYRTPDDAGTDGPVNE